MSVVISSLRGIGEIRAGDSVAEAILQGIERSPVEPAQGDICVVSSKIISKAEGRRRRLREVEINDEAKLIAKRCRKDARIVQCILDESIAVSRVKAEVLITRHRLGFISANAAVDTSNVGEGEAVLLLPENPAESAEVIYEALAQALGFGVPIIISDSHGRPFRYGTVGVALACFGLNALRDYRGTRDLDNHELETTEVALADQLATAADLVAGQGDEGTPVTWFQGVTADSGLHDRANAKDTVESLLRDPEKDLYA